MKLVKFVLGEYQSNCYIIYKDFAAMVIDPGYPSAKVNSFLVEKGLIVEKVYLTHGHIDHVGGVNALKKRYPDAIVYAPRKDLYWYQKNPENGLYEDVKIDIYVEKNDIIKFQEITFKVLETPGHSYGSSCLYFEEVLFSGDTLFYHSYGRTDLYLGDYKTLYNSIHNLLFKLPEKTVVYPGHGRTTTILEEKTNNPINREELL